MVGAVVWGPKTLKVMVPVALEPEDAARVELMLPTVMAVPAVPVPVGVGSDRRGGQAHDGLGHVPNRRSLAAAVLLVSPL